MSPREMLAIFVVAICLAIAMLSASAQKDDDGGTPARQNQATQIKRGTTANETQIVGGYPFYDPSVTSGARSAAQKTTTRSTP